MKNMRVIARLDIKGANVVKGIQFECLRVVGDPAGLVKKYADQGADEIIYIDTVASLYRRDNLVNVVNQASENLFIPLTVGGGVRSVEDVARLLEAGAEKVAINTAAVANPPVITEAARRFGSQCIVVSIDVKKLEDGTWGVFTDKAREDSGKNVLDWVKEAESLGAGEILLTSVDRDGKENGFDIELLNAVTSVVSIPVIASGGAGSIEDFQECALKCNVSALASASLLHYGKCGINEIKGGLKAVGIPVRRLLNTTSVSINYPLPELFDTHRYTHNHFIHRKKEEEVILSSGHPPNQMQQNNLESEHFDIGIINCGINNSKSVVGAFRFLGRKAKLIKNPEEVKSAKSLILPGVGTFPEGMRFLRERGLIEPIKERVSEGIPIFGICLGMQLLFTESVELGLHRGLDLIQGKVVKLKSPKDVNMKAYTLPHIGWNVMIPTSNSFWTVGPPLIDSKVYYLHSFYPVVENGAEIIATGSYGGQDFCSIVKKKNIFGTQFHPEKSGSVGLELIRRFCEEYNL